MIQNHDALDKTKSLFLHLHAHKIGITMDSTENFLDCDTKSTPRALLQ